jgi:NAD(P)-dependent dehydrogenase (short-subunit alcohol dehydrogenase family)
MPKPLEGMTAVIIGATEAVGPAVAAGLIASGARVAITSLTNDAEELLALRQLGKRLESGGSPVLTEALDLGNGANVQVGIRQLAKQLGQIDLMVVAPYLDVRRAAERMTDAEWSRALGYNLSGVFYACRAVAREMLGREDAPRGRIVVLLREAATRDGVVALAVGRAGAEALVGSLAREWEAKGIAINAIVFAAEEYADSAEQVTGLVLKLAGADLAETGQILRLG